MEFMEQTCPLLSYVTQSKKYYIEGPHIGNFSRLAWQATTQGFFIYLFFLYD